MIRIITDSVASIPKNMLKRFDIQAASLYVRHAGVEHVESDMDIDGFYERIHEMADDPPTSSQPSQHVLERLFESAAKADDEVLGVFMSSGLSGTFDGAVRAARSVASRNIGFKYALIDSTSAGFDEAWPVFAAAAARDAGATLQGCVDSVLRSIRSSRFLFTPDSLTFLQKGGRIGGASALLGTLMKICPVLTVREGQADTFAKVRTHRRALERIVEELRNDIEAHGLKNIVVHYIGDKAPALKWAREVVEPLVGRSVTVLPVSPVIGAHVGPAMGIAYECGEPIDGKFGSGYRIGVCTCV